MELRPYQEDSIRDVSVKLSQGKRRVVFQLATGGGKTVCFSSICNRFITKSSKSVLIIVHREELMKQTLSTIYDWYGIVGEIVGKKMEKAPLYVGMVETINNRLKKDPKAFDDVGLVIMDECHIANHFKIFDYFPLAYILGFTATPLSASKKRPLKNYFEDIVTAIDIPDLIATGSLVKNVTYDPHLSVDRSTLSVKMGEFDGGKMAGEYTKAKQVENTIRAYEDLAIGTKTIIFNCNVEHSKTVMERFVRDGYDCKHLDGTTPTDERKEIIRWFKSSPHAILCNCNILTTGFDEPTIQTVIVNKATLSLPLWLQMCGRGGRPCSETDKRYFRIIDLGGNAATFGDWDFARDWKDIFVNPGKPRDGVAPVKECPECFAISHPSKKMCEAIDDDGVVCGYKWPEKVVVEMPIELKIFSQNIDVKQIIEDNQNRKEYYPFFQIPVKIASFAKRQVKDMSDDMATQILGEVHEKCKEWCHEKDKKYNKWHKERAEETFFQSLKSHFKKWSEATQMDIISA